jgi:WbqC-like protein family
MSVTVACVHQPNFLPWLGFFSKIAGADLYIAMDNTQFPRNSWVNRVKIGGRGEPMWLTVPVRHAGRLDLPIAEVEISYEVDWVTKHLRTIQQRYARAPHFREIFPSIEQHLAARPVLLEDLNLALIRTLLALCGVEREIVLGRFLAVDGMASALIAAMCRKAEAAVYLAGEGAADYDDLAIYDALGIEYRSAGFVHPEYAQTGGAPFERGLSIIDALFNIGPERTRELLVTSLHPVRRQLQMIGS